MAIGLVWTKVVALSVMFTLTMTFGLMTLKLVKFFSRKGGKTKGGIVISLLNCFAGGLFLGTFLLQLLPEVRELFEGVLERYDVETTFPVSEAVTAAGFFIVMALEHIIGMIHNGGHEHSHGGTHQSAPAEHLPSTAIRDHNGEDHHGEHQNIGTQWCGGESRVNNQTLHLQNEQKLGHQQHQLRNNSNGYINDAYVQGTEKEPSVGAVDDQPNSEDGYFPDVDEEFYESHIPKQDDGYISRGNGINHLKHDSQGPRYNSENGQESLRSGHHDGPPTNDDQMNGSNGQIYKHVSEQVNDHREGHERHSSVEKVVVSWENEDNSDNPEAQVSSLRSIVLLLALSLHTLFEGLALGLQHHESEIWALLIAVCVHKVVIVIALGIELAKVNDKVKMMVGSIFIFAIMSPVGIGIGTAISETGSPDDLATDTASAILQGLATGTFLYVTFFEVLQHELDHSPDLRKVLAVLVGFGSIIGLKFMGSDH